MRRVAVGLLLALTVGAAAAAPPAGALQPQIDRLADQLRTPRTTARSDPERRALRRAIVRTSGVLERRRPAAPGRAYDQLDLLRLAVARAATAARHARHGRRPAARGAARRARRILRRPRSALLAALAPVLPDAPLGAELVPPAPSPSPASPAPAPASTPTPLADARTSGYAALPVPAAQQPHERTSVHPLDAGEVDERGVAVYRRDGERHPHPTVLENYALAMLTSTRFSDDPEYVRRAEANADELLDHATVLPGPRLYLAYTFAYAPFQRPELEVAPPWYSGMAQGRMLLVLARLYEVTGDPRWRAAEDAIYATTFDPISATEPWHTAVDDDGYLWFEEYPSDYPTAVPSHVLNGHMSALMGYWKRAVTTDDPVADQLFDAGATTALHYARSLRRPGQASAYAVREPRQNALYHDIHTRQLRQLALLTGDPQFDALADDYVADTRSDEGRSSFASHPH